MKEGPWRIGQVATARGSRDATPRGSGDGRKPSPVWELARRHARRAARETDAPACQRDAACPGGDGQDTEASQRRL